MIEDTYTYMNIQTNTYGIHTNMAMIQTNACRYCRGSQLSAQRPQPGPQPWRGSDTAGRRPAGHTPAQARPPSQDGVRLGLTSPRPHESTVDCRAAGGQCRSDVWNLPGGPATLRNQTRTQFPARRGRAAHWQDSSQVSILGHSRWLASETRIIPSSVMIHGDLLGSFRWIITTWPVTAGPRDTWKSAARWSR